MAACADLNPEAAQAKARQWDIPKPCPVEELLSDESIGFVVNLTIPRAHGQIMAERLSHGKSVYTEKPFTVTRDEAQQTMSLAGERTPRVLSAPDTFLGGAHHTCPALIDRGDIGEPLAATAFMACHGHEHWHPAPAFYYQERSRCHARVPRRARPAHGDRPRPPHANGPHRCHPVCRTEARTTSHWISPDCVKPLPAVIAICLAAILPHPARCAAEPTSAPTANAAASFAPFRLIDPDHAPFDPVSVPPMIVPPPQPVFDARKFGATGDGTTFDTAALQKAIDACAGTGGTVYLAGGKFLTAPLVLKSRMTFYIDKDAALLGSTLPEDFPDRMPAQTAAQALRKSLLFAEKADGLILDGEGEIDGQGQRLPMGGKEPLRPSLLRIFSSTGVTVRNLTLRNPRMWTQVYSECTGLTIDHVKVYAPHGYCPNLDGMDICDSDHVTISNCLVEAQDDGICLKCHGPRGLHDIVVRNNNILDFDANAIKLGTATHGPIERVTIENNLIRGARFGGLCIESVDGAHVRDITARGLDMSHVCQPVYIRLSHRDPPPNDLQFSNPIRTAAGSIEHVVIENLRALHPDAKTAPGSTITGVPDAKPGDIVVRNAYVEMPGGLTAAPAAPPGDHDGEYPQSNQFGQPPGYAFYVRHTAAVTFERVRVKPVKPDVRPGLATDDAEVRTIDCTNLAAAQ